MQSTFARIAIKESGYLSKSTIIFLLKLSISAAILGWLIHTLQAKQLFTVLRQIKVEAVLAAFALLGLNLGLQAWKWHYLLRRIRPACRARTACYSLLAGFPLGLLTPGRWGELGRGFFLKEWDRGEVFLLAALDKLYNLLCVMFLGSMALCYLVYANMLAGFPIWLAVAIVSTAIVLNGLALSPLAATRLIPGDDSRLAGLSVTFRKLLLLPCQARVVWSLSTAFVITYCLQLVILIDGFAETAVVSSFAASAVTFLSKSALPIAIGDLGIREGAAAFFFQRIEVAPAIAFNASLLLFVINLLIPSLAGMFFIWQHRMEESS